MVSLEHTIASPLTRLWLYATAGCGTIITTEPRLKRLVSLGVWCNWDWISHAGAGLVYGGSCIAIPIVLKF